MRGVFLPLLLLSSFASAQKPSDWRKAGTAPAVFAKNVDGALLKIKNAHCKARYSIEAHPLGKGGANSELMIRDNKTFRIKTVRVDRTASNPIVTYTLIGNKGRVYALEGQVGYKELKAGADPGFLKPSNSYLKAWAEGFPRIAFQGFVTGKGPFQGLVNELLKPSSGYTVSVDKRVMQGGGRSIPQARILAVRKPAVAKKLGTSTIEIIVDTDLWLPLQIRVREEKSKKVNGFYEWTGAWNGPARFDDVNFKLPK